ncbi:type I-F CRISPR-associated endoribonuclease Cas6/Csy4 [Glaciimonas sp. PAMC28666]|uniref:type I-F CRISPR-associated endoribonuclease Cas6/Csy4 n=1 Tax=Glaciimonas sp. PAMC28666 TaxID=2807626 RepID=UPI001963EF2C|nr:type I-F CRISPR-associated endoribonuclease Cas6/Csy4 [Glaciimonas sp. PAMC28666]QRX80826.1 type I-F CRISPR-associated endoribonuclease Cas6/Csy4 [Glaciimonas sp. PAMC28666]
MQPQAYIDLRVISSLKSDRPNGTAHDVMALLIKFTHAIAARQGFKHAVAFPQAKIGARPSPGNHARVFALARESLETLADELEKQQFIRDYVNIGRVKVLPSDFKPTAFVEYRRYRVPNRKSRLEASRAKRMAEADSLPHLRLNSSTSGHGFSLFLKPIHHETALCAEGTLVTFEPDVYGLSVFTRRFALPVTPEDAWPVGRMTNTEPVATD